MNRQSPSLSNRFRTPFWKRRQARRRGRHSPFRLVAAIPPQKTTKSQHTGEHNHSTSQKHGDTVSSVNPRNQYARLLAKRPLAQNTLELVFALPMGPLSFRPGQFVSFRIGTDDLGNAMMRSYSIASLPEEPELRLILRTILDGKASAFFAALPIGGEAMFTGPMGFFVNELSHPGDVVYVATGTGIAAIFPMLRETLLRPEASRVYLLWGLRCEADVFWEGELLALQTQHPRFSFHVYLSKPQGPWPDTQRGRVLSPLLALLPSLSHATFYLCGNGHMIEDAKATLVAQGIPRKRQIRTEAFFD